MKPIVYFLLICGIACNSPMKDNSQAAGDSSGTNTMDEATQAASSNSSQNASGGTANAGSGVAPGEEDANVVKGGNEPVSNMLRFKDRKYSIVTKGDGTGRTLVIASTDLKAKDTLRADSTVIHDVKGVLGKTTVEDLDNDKNPEIYLFTYGTGTEATGSVYGVTYIGGKAIRIFSNDVDNISDLKGYRGRDSFYVQQREIVRSYPVYTETDPESKPSGGKKTIKYTLTKQGNSYRLKEAK